MTGTIGYETYTLAELMDAAVPDLLVEDSAELRPGTEPFSLIVEVDDDGRPWELVDGHHRLCGMVRWAESRGKDISEVEVTVVAVLEHDDLDGAKMNERAALRSILSEVGESL